VNWRLTIPVTAAVLAICVIGSFVTKFSFAQMIFLAPVAVVVAGATIGIVMLWVKIIRESRQQRHQ
jgi:hypothetical protein